MTKVCLQRVYLKEATHSLLQVDGLNVSLAIELPWAGNQQSISCIPEGEYAIRNRYSPRFKEHIEVVAVPNRSNILFHPANNAKRDLRGCIAPVTTILNPGWGADSKMAMSKLFHLIKDKLPSGKVVLTIQKAIEEKVIQIIQKGKL